MIWLYFSSVVLGLIVVWAILNVRADYTSRKTLTSYSVVIVWAAYLLHAGILIWAAVLQAWQMPVQPELAYPLGIVLTITGIAIPAAAIWNFRSIKRMSGLQIDEIITSGIYAWSRNPQNLGWGLALLGIAVMGRSGFALFLLALFAFSIHGYIVLLEEPYLKDVYGDVYQSYRSKTSRYLGFSK